MKVIAEFVDARNGKRYFPGDGDKVDPPLESKQEARLIAAGCLEEGDENRRVVDTEKARLDALTIPDLKLFAAYNKIDLGDATKKADLIAAIELALEASGLRSDGPTINEFVAAGYKASGYPPSGYALKSPHDEIEAAIAAEKAAS